MIFDGPFLAERYAAVGDFIERHPDAVDPIVRSVIQASKKFSASEAFKAIYQLDCNVRQIQNIFKHYDIIAALTVGTLYQINEVLAEPFYTNATNGLYMNFVNMADLCAVAVPNGFLDNGMPMGITLIAPAFHDFFLCKLADTFYPLRVDITGAIQAEV